MRVIAGIRKGRKLSKFKASWIRPTADTVKEFIFNHIGSQIIQAKILDLFSGTGNLGIEALSRGAAEVIFVDREKVAVQIIKKNLQLTQFEAKSQVIRSDSITYLNRIANQNNKFDIIFADPPYYNNLLIKLVHIVNINNLLNKEGLIILEHRSDRSVASNFEKLILQETHKIGDTAVTFFQYKG